ncbi:MAG: hypothetical protein AAF399_24810 [Bacteroidota bacterium]
MKGFVCHVSLCLLLFMGWQGSPLFAQTGEGVEVGISLSGISYLGDFSETDAAFRRFHPGLDLALQQNHDRMLQFQFHGGFGKFADQFEGSWPQVAGVDPVNFVETTFFYGNLGLAFRPLATKRIQPFVAIGAGLMYFVPRDQDGKQLPPRTQTRDETEASYNRVIPQLPATIGVMGRLNQRIQLKLAYTFRFVPSDYLDNTGALGAREGFDSLHAILIGLHLNLRPEE